MWDLIVRGGPVMIPLGACSVLGLAIILERAFYLRKPRIIPPEVLRVVNSIREFKDVGMAIALCQQNGGAFANIVRAGLESLRDRREGIKEALEDQGRQEVRVLERGLVILETVASIAPLLGLLGTVLGMQNMFEGVSVEGLGRGAQLSAGIAEALITTIFGLSIGIASLVCFNFFTSRAEDIIADIEMYSTSLIRKLQELPDLGPASPARASDPHAD